MKKFTSDWTDPVSKKRVQAETSFNVGVVNEISYYVKSIRVQALDASDAVLDELAPLAVRAVPGGQSAGEVFDAPLEGGWFVTRSMNFKPEVQKNIAAALMVAENNGIWAIDGVEKQVNAISSNCLFKRVPITALYSTNTNTLLPTIAFGDNAIPDILQRCLSRSGNAYGMGLTKDITSFKDPVTGDPAAYDVLCISIPKWRHLW